MQTVNLRGHHLGAIYDIVAMVKITNEAKNYSEAIETQTAGLLIVNHYPYPYQTIKTVGVLFKSIFEEKTKIHIISGLDNICNAGCIQDKNKNNNIFAKLCKDKNSKDDLGVLGLFNCEVGKTYLAEQIIKKAEKLATITGAPRWRLLLMIAP